MGSKKVRHVKVLVEIDIMQPLLQGTTIKMQGVTKWIEFRYERCRDFCYGYGIISHAEKNCNRKRANIGRNTQYASWMKVSQPRSPTKKNNYPRK